MAEAAESWPKLGLKKLQREARRIAAQGKKTLLKVRLGQRWQVSGGELSQRIYPDYETYRTHQRLKLDARRDKSIQAYDKRFFAALRERLIDLPIDLRNRSVLCLAARQGTEVRAFIDQGAFAIGIDLNPGPENRYVVHGDFHALQYADASIDLVYTNSLDHAFELSRILAEVKRVLAPEGKLIAEVGCGTREGGAPGFYESLSWADVDQVLQSFQDSGFELDQRTRFEVPWAGEQLVLRKATTDT